MGYATEHDLNELEWASPYRDGDTPEPTPPRPQLQLISGGIK